MSSGVHIAHVLSSDLGIEASMPYIEPLLARGWKVTAISPDGPHVSPALARGVHWKPLAIRRQLDVIGDARGSLQLLRYFTADRYQIVHTHNIKVGLMSRVLAGVARAPIVVHTMHGLAYSMQSAAGLRMVHTGLEWLANRHVSAILAQSEEDRATIVESGAAPSHKLRMVGNGIDLTRFDPVLWNDERRRVRAELGLAAGDFLFLSAGRLVREKGYVELLEAAVEARRLDPRVRLAVAGRRDPDKSDALPAELFDRARENGVIVLGERAEMPPLYAAADAVVLASWREGLPRALMEGAAMGKPLVATDIRGCREIVQPPHNGLLVTPRSAASLTTAMLRLARDEAACVRWSAENRADAAAKYDLRRAVGRVVGVYDELLARART